MTQTAIEWTDRVWNPVRGCSRVSPGCDNCFAMGQARRHDWRNSAHPETGCVTTTGHYHGLTTIRRGKVDWSGVVRFVPEKLAEPLSWRKPQRIFVNSMSDLFHESLSNEEIAAVFGVMAACPQHTFQVLTKRPKRMREWFEWVGGAAKGWLQKYGGKLADLECDVRVHFIADTAAEAIEDVDEYDDIGPLPETWPLPNVWLGVSVENQETADERIPLLLETPAAVRWVSAEPLLGPVDLRRFLDFGGACECDVSAHQSERCEGKGNAGWIRCTVGMRRLDWLVVGGESGPGARQCDVDWLRDLVQQCARRTGWGRKSDPLPVFVKQLGAHYVDAKNGIGGAQARPDPQLVPPIERLAHKKGGNTSEWPEDLRVRQFPEVRP